MHGDGGLLRLEKHFSSCAPQTGMLASGVTAERGFHFSRDGRILGCQSSSGVLPHYQMQVWGSLYVVCATRTLAVVDQS